jgi:hypothetical protein
MMIDKGNVANSSSIIASLEKAAELHQLDAQGVLEQLGNAVEICNEGIKFHTDKRDEFMLAKAAYLAEAQRLFALAPGADRRAHKGMGFRAWCAAHNINFNTAAELARIHNSPDPLKGLNERRQKQNIKCKASQARIHAVARKVRQRPLEVMMELWGKLSAEERLEFIDWLLLNLGDTKAAVAKVAASVIRSELSASL